MKGLIIIGAGGHGMVAAEAATMMNKWKKIFFLDDSGNQRSVIGYEIKGKCSEYKNYSAEEWDFFIAFGDNRLRLDWIEKLSSEGYTIPVIIHPASSVSSFSKLGIGSIVMAGSVINCNTTIGKGCILNTCCSINHECILEDGVHISPSSHIGGVVKIGTCTWLCIGVCVAHDIIIGKESIVAAGAVVINNISDNVLVAGIPANVKATLSPLKAGTERGIVALATKEGVNTHISIIKDNEQNVTNITAADVNTSNISIVDINTNTETSANQSSDETIQFAQPIAQPSPKDKDEGFQKHVEPKLKNIEDYIELSRSQKNISEASTEIKTDLQLDLQTDSSDIKNCPMIPEANNSPAKTATKTYFQNATTFSKEIQAFIKRSMDIIISIVALALLWPVMLCVMLYIKLNSPGSAIYKQTRIGRNGEPFTIYKFRTLTNEIDEKGMLLPAEQRLKPWGLKLRKTDLDELPQLVNVLKGDMSLIGPRPLLVHYVSLYTARQLRRHDMRPGITGLTQVSGRNTLSWEEKFECDIDYINNWSLWLDIKILFKTFNNALFDSNSDTHEFFKEYTGSDKKQDKNVES